MNDIIVIIPTYNERDNIKPLIERIFNLPVAPEVLVVDDNSPDGTAQIVEQLQQIYPSLHLLKRPEKRGLGPAYCEAFKWALHQSYRYIIQMDGDFSHDPNDIPRFLEAAEEADLVLGSRYYKGIRVINWPLKRLLLSLCAAYYVRLITGMPFADPTSGYKCFRRTTLEKIPLNEIRSNGYCFQIEMTHRVWREGLKIVEIPIIFTDRFQGTSKLSTGIIKEAIWMVWNLWIQNGFSRKPKNPRMKN